MRFQRSDPGRVCFFLAGVFEEKCPTLTVGSFLATYGPLFSFVQLELRMSKTYWKRQNLILNKTGVQKLENILRIPTLAILVFFSENFLMSPKGSPFIQQEGC